MKSARRNRLKPSFNTGFWHTMFVFTLGILITCALYNPFISTSNTVVPSVLGRSYPLQQPDIHTNEGGTIHLESMTAIVEGGTFAKDVYLRVDRTVRGNPIEVNGLWQVSDIWNARFRFHSNDDEVSAIEAQKNYILSFPYSEALLTTDQGVRFDEQSLKIVRGETVTGPWTVIEKSVVDADNNTVSALTNKGGFFMVAGGFYKRIESVSENSGVQNIGESEVVGKKDDEENVDKEDSKAVVEKDSESIEKVIAKNVKKKTVTLEKPRSIGEAATRLSGALSDFFSVFLGSF